MASQLLIKLRQFSNSTQWVNFENFSRILGHRKIDMYPNLWLIELCLLHGRQRELTELKYLSKWRHNCSSNYGKFRLQRKRVNFENFPGLLAHRPININPNLCPIELGLVHGRQRELTELKYMSKWRHNCSSNYGKFRAMSLFWKFLAIIGASPDKYESKFMPDRAMPPTWPSERVDRIKISVKMESQLLLKLRQILTATQMS